MTHSFAEIGSYQILVVGDTHAQWDDVDRQFVEAGEQDIALFVGDLADEDLEIVTRIAALSCRKAVVLGNHDAWRASRSGDTSVLVEMSRVLGADHVGYGLMPVDEQVAILGARPFSWGGPWGHWRKLYAALHLPTTAEEAAATICEAADATPDSVLVVLAHNGPTGLGSTRDAPFGRDFRRPAIDWGDVDLRMALDSLRERGRRVPLVVAGHMHHRLCGGGERRRVARDGDTVVLNAAVVPRHVIDAAGEGAVGEPGVGEGGAGEGTGRLRHFMRVVLEDGVVTAADDIWVNDAAEVARTIALEL